MRLSLLLSIIVSFFLVSACSMTVPQNAEEFRQMAPGAFLGTVEKFEVKRPFSKVARAFKKMGPKCLNKRLTSTTTTYDRYGGHTQTVVTDYKTTVKVHKNTAELHLQQKFVSGVIEIGNIPEGGSYMLVADAERAGRNKTKLTIYTATVYDNLIKAIKSWAEGKTLCPDLTK